MLPSYTAKNMQQINGLFRKHNNWSGYIFRGQELCEWGLVPSLFRHSVNNALDISELVNHHLNQFQLAIRGRANENKVDDDYGVWAIGQHHGLYTPLLDWTASPYIALFFAFCNERQIISKEKIIDINLFNSRMDQNRAIYCLNAKEINKLYFEALAGEFKKQDANAYKQYVIEHEYKLNDAQIGKLLFESNGIDLVNDNSKYDLEDLWDEIQDLVEQQWIRIYVSNSNTNTRMISQRGLFTFLSTSIDMIELLKDKGLLIEKYLVKIEIENTARAQVLKELENMNVSHMSLFPDLYGSSHYANYKYSRYSQKAKLDTANWIS